MPLVWKNPVNRACSGYFGNWRNKKIINNNNNNNDNENNKQLVLPN